MQRVPKEAFVAALPVLQQRLRENYPSSNIKIYISNSNATPRNPFAPKLSYGYPFSVIVFVDGARYQCIPYSLPSGSGIFGLQPVNKSISAIVGEWVQNLDTKILMAKAKARISPFKEDLIAAAWHPRRVELWISLGGPEVLDTL